MVIIVIFIILMNDSIEQKVFDNFFEFLPKLVMQIVWSHWEPAKIKILIREFNIKNPRRDNQR